jgi:hypothetical protein
MASHHHIAAIAPKDIRRSASGVRREISSVLRVGIVDWRTPAFFIGVPPRILGDAHRFDQQLVSSVVASSGRYFRQTPSNGNG